MSLPPDDSSHDDNPPKIAVGSHPAPSTYWMQEQTGTPDRVAAHAGCNCLRHICCIAMAQARRTGNDRSLFRRGQMSTRLTRRRIVPDYQERTSKYLSSRSAPCCSHGPWVMSTCADGTSPRWTDPFLRKQGAFRPVVRRNSTAVYSP
jgi:hypothetical protein